MHRAFTYLSLTLSLLGCVNQKPAIKVTSTIPISCWGQMYYRLAPNHVCADGANPSPGYSSILEFRRDRQIVEIDACTRLESIVADEKLLEISQDGTLIGYKEKLFQLRSNPKDSSESFVEAFCTNKLLLETSPDTTPVEMRLSATPDAGVASFDWAIKGENYFTAVTEGLKMARSQASGQRTYTATSDGGNVSMEITLTADPAKENTYPGFYRMENGVAIDVQCRLAQ